MSFLNSHIVRHLIAEILPRICGGVPIDRLRNAVGGNFLQKGIAKAFAFPECTQEIVDALWLSLSDLAIAMPLTPKAQCFVMMSL